MGYSMKKVFENINSLTDEYIKILEDVVNIESPSLEKSKVDEVGKYFINLAAKNGWETEIEKFEDFGDVVTVIMNRNAPGGVITLSGHIDTVHPVGLFGNPAAKREGNKYTLHREECSCCNEGDKCCQFSKLFMGYKENFIG